VSPVEDIVARGNEIREDDGMSPVKMMLSRLYPMELEVRFCERVGRPRAQRGESCIGLKISRPSPCAETPVPSDYYKK
jgi:hypothetical protein